MYKCLECQEEFETAKVEYVNRVGHEREIFNVCPYCKSDNIEEFPRNELGELDNLVGKVEQWFIDRNLHTADPNKQMLKLFEELGEVASGMARNDLEEIKDGIGDTLVVLIGLSMQ